MDTINRLATSTRELRIKVLGVGGAGCPAVAHLAREDLAGVSFTVINTDASALAQSPIEERLLIGTRSCRGLGAGGDLERGRAAAEEDSPAIAALTENADLVFSRCRPGRWNGIGRDAGHCSCRTRLQSAVLGVVVTPFQFEGVRRQQQASFALHELKGVADAVICMPNQKLLRLVDETAPLSDALAGINAFIADAVRSIWTLVTRRGIVQADFASLCAATQGRHAESSLAIGRAIGENRVAEAADKLLMHPLIDEGALLSDATIVLVSIVASPGLSMGEVHGIMERISSVAHSAHIVMGAVIDESLADQLTVTLIAGRGESEAAAALRVEAPAPGVENGHATVALSRGSAKAQPAPVADVAGATRPRKPGQRLRQSQLPLEIISRGRFEKSEPTIHHGQDLDVPTYIRRGVALN